MAASYQMAAELSFYIPSQPYVYELAGEGKFNQYNLWKGPETGTDSVLVSNPGSIDDAYMNTLFDSIKEIKRVSIQRGIRVIKTYSIYYGRNFHGFR